MGILALWAIMTMVSKLPATAAYTENYPPHWTVFGNQRKGIINNIRVEKVGGGWELFPDGPTPGIQQIKKNRQRRPPGK